MQRLKVRMYKMAKTIFMHFRLVVMIVQIPYLHVLQTELSAQNFMEIQKWLGNQVFLSVLS